MNVSPQPVEVSRSRRWLRVLRPLLWWLLLVLLLFAHRTHQRLSEQTRLTFAVTLLDRGITEEAVVRLGDNPAVSGQRVSLGWHKLTISHPKAEPFLTNLFIWYGERDLGKIALRRAQEKGSDYNIVFTTAVCWARLPSCRANCALNMPGPSTI
jgi:hypothetical protein